MISKTEKNANSNKWDELRHYVKTKSETKKNSSGAFKGVINLTHRNPDPDGIASAWGLKQLFLSESIESTLAYSGSIERPENRAMVDLLNIEMMDIQDIDFNDFYLVALVDTQPGTGNNDLQENILPAIVIDHHPIVDESNKSIYWDIRKEIGSTSTIITEYIMSSGIDISRELATALYYGIATDTMDLSRDFYQDDMLAAQFLYPKLIPETLSKIKNPEISLQYFTEFIAAFKSSFQYDNIFAVDAGEISTPDLLAQIADLIVRVEGINWAIAIGTCSDTINFSIRSNFRGRQAGIMARKIVQGLGTAGGHDMTAEDR
jgi:nanoRNase/pAp phosphatase (c-di-AMP/oligoRNAs hydrolase)